MTQTLITHWNLNTCTCFADVMKTKSTTEKESKFGRDSALLIKSVLPFKKVSHLVLSHLSYSAARGEIIMEE